MEKFQKVIQGRDTLKRAGELADKLGMRHPLVIGGSLLTGRLLRQVPQLLSSPVFSEYHPNPDLRDAVAGAEMYRKEACDGLISVGGGSCIDTAKTIKALLAAGDIGQVLAGDIPADPAVPHLAIPGTAGSGAEATQNAVVYVDDQKASVSAPCLKPDGVLLDAALLDTLPLYHRKSCALDALSQGIESYWSRNATEDSRVHAYLAILGVLDNLKGYLEGDPHAAESMLDAAYQSGKAIQMTRTTAAHAMSYQITKQLGIAHGHACMLTLPFLWEKMLEQEDIPEIMADLSAKMRLGDPRMGSRLLKGILLWMDFPPTRKPDAETLELLVLSVPPEKLLNHPQALAEEDLRRIYQAAFLPIPPMERQMCLDLWNYYGR